MSVANPIRAFLQSPSTVLEYGFDWSDWLGDDVITGSTWVADVGATAGSATFTPTLTVVWISAVVAGASYDVTNTISTQQGRTEKRTFRIVGVQR